MADISRHRTSAGASTPGPQPSRLQRRKPASLQINPPSSSRWNAAIPLLSPLITSPTAMDLKSRDEQLQTQSQQRSQGTEPEKATAVFKKWQHPAAPFCYETASFGPKFYVPV